MKKSSIIFLQMVIVLIGIISLVFMLWEPHLEGRNANATLFEIYFNDPFLIYAYTVSLAFFVALFQALKVLEYVKLNKLFSQEAVMALGIIKYCAITLAAFIMAAEVYLFIAVRGKDDITGGVAMGLIMTLISAVIAAAAAVFEKLLQSALDIKSENDLTV